MATYKVIQDIEAEDKLLGPLTLRQFIYAVIVVVQGFIAFKLATAISPFFVIPFLGPMIFFGMLAAPFGRDQSSEIWLLAKIRFFLKPRKRIWDQTGMKELVTITAPKTIEKPLTDGLTQTEVKSRLQALANTIDSRGWAVKNVNVNLSNPAYSMAGGYTSDRLVSPGMSATDAENDQYAADDIMDETRNPTAQALDSMISKSFQSHRQAIVASVQSGQPTAQDNQQQTNDDYWFMDQPDPANIPSGYAAFGGGKPITPGSSIDNPVPDTGRAEQALLNKVRSKPPQSSISYGHTKVIQPLGSQPVPDTPTPAQTDQEKAKAEHGKAEIARLATNDDLNVATIAREAKKATDLDDGEVVISLR